MNWRWSVFKGSAVRFTLILTISYVLISLLIYSLQYKLLYFPDKSSSAEIAKRAETFGFKLWPPENGRYRGLISVTERSPYQGTAIVFHGNAGSAIDRIYYQRALEPLGYRVILAEYPGYGGRPGNLGEASFIPDAVETIRIAFEQFGQPLYLWGESLGCGVVAGSVERSQVKVAGLALLTPWDTLPNLAQKIYWFLPARWLVKDKYDNVNNLQAYRGPVAVIMAGKDEIIPNPMSRNLYKSVGSRKRMWVFEKAGHNSWPAETEAGWWKEVMDFLSHGF